MADKSKNSANADNVEPVQLGDDPVLNDLDVSEDDVAGTNTVASTDTPTTANQDAAIHEAVADESHALQPGDDGYDVNSDPVIPSSALAEVVAAELAGSNESPTRDALVEAQKK